ncbi:hypothetical protein E2C01_070755 [Portunus trituberculatus]|uniref:Uncharacterized protein n=1 Tax=Portunus trituberculatus TaxID=210409 RepID=A0A5B7I2H7_PORTR|nr:hypothetical protein [Portunus trituberculatus]
MTRIQKRFALSRRIFSKFLVEDTHVFKGYFYGSGDGLARFLVYHKEKLS